MENKNFISKRVIALQLAQENYSQSAGLYAGGVKPSLEGSISPCLAHVVYRGACR